MDSALGERFILSATALDDFAFSFHRQGKSVQLLRKNVHYRAADKLPIHRAVERSFADSVLGASTIVSLPQPERKSVLVELSDLFVADLPLIGYQLEAEYRLPYHLD